METMTNIYKDSRLRDWRRLVGVTGDLADIIVATLSLASTEYNVSKIRLVDFYSIFDQLQKEFPDLIPPLHSTRANDYVYSKKLASALESALSIGIRISNPQFQFLEVEATLGKGNLERIQKRAGEAFIERLKPIAKRLSELV
jgi:hypothetical protein